MFWFSLNLVVFSLCMKLNFGDITTSSKKILSTVAGRWRSLLVGGALVLLLQHVLAALWMTI